MVRYLMAISFVVGLIFLSFGGSLVQADSVLIAEKGVSSSVIVVAGDATCAEESAAKELQKYLNKITGAEITIQADAKSTLAKDIKSRIFIGKTADVKKRLGDFDWAEVKNDGIVIKSMGSDLIIAGNRPGGTLNAVYTFLQDTLGCRWYAQDMEEVIPVRSTLAIDSINVVFSPPFEFRELFTRPMRDPMFALKSRMNGRQYLSAFPKCYGETLNFGSGHTLMHKFLKPEEHFETHPEWFSFDKKSGKRIDNGQICFINREARTQCAAEVLAYLKAHPDTKILSISPDDNARYCQCDKCESFIAGQETGKVYMDGIKAGRTGAALDFVNAVARQVEKEYPDVLISFLAYWQTNFPPKTVKPHRNVMIHCAVMMRTYCDSIPETPCYVETLPFWRKYSPKVYIWDYVTNFKNFIRPFPTYFTLAENLRYYESLGIEGVFAQGSWGSASDFIRPMAWVNAQLLWNPHQDERALTREFLNAYYGKAGPILMEYMEFLCKVARDADEHIGCYDATTKHWLSFENLTRATKIYDRAIEAVADDPVKLYRVRRERLGLDLVWYERYDELLATAKKTGAEFLGPKDRAAEFKRFEANEFKENVYAEGRSYSKYLVKLKEMLTPNVEKSGTK